jgi:hypothetical protein
MRRSWRIALGILFGAPILFIVALIIFYLIENYRGSRAWAACQGEYQKRNESLAPADFTPAPVPDEQNLLAAAPLSAWLNFSSRTPATNPMPQISQMEPGNWQLSRFTRVREWTEQFGVESGGRSRRTNILSATELMKNFARFDPGLRELFAAVAQRPLVRSTQDPLHNEQPVAQLDRALIPALAIHASARLALRDPTNALADTLLILRLAEASKDYPRYGALLSRADAVNTALQPIWEGLAVHRWRDSDLVHLQRALTNLNLIAEASRVLRGERACAVQTIAARIPRRLQYSYSYQNWGPSMQRAWIHAGIGQIGPRGWRQRNLIALCHYYDQYLLEPIAAVNEGRSGEALRLVNIAFEDFHAGCGFYDALARINTPNFAFGLPQFMRVQIGVHQAIVACGIERHRLTHDTLPVRLEELVPLFLDRLPESHPPLDYRVENNGRFTLKVNLNAEADGWESLPDSGGDRGVGPPGGWRWEYPEPSRR